jgi:hypothetical protein
VPKGGPTLPELTFFFPRRSETGVEKKAESLDLIQFLSPTWALNDSEKDVLDHILSLYAVVPHPDLLRDLFPNRKVSLVHITTCLKNMGLERAPRYASRDGIAELIAQGMDSVQIAEQLGVRLSSLEARLGNFGIECWSVEKLHLFPDQAKLVMSRLNLDAASEPVLAYLRQIKLYVTFDNV